MAESAASVDDSEDREQTTIEKESDWLGVALGVLTFLLGVGLLVFTFVNAARLYFGPQTVRIESGTETDIASIGATFSEAFLQIGILVVMSVVGSLIASKGIRLYSASRSRRGD